MKTLNILSSIPRHISSLKAQQAQPSFINNFESAFCTSVSLPGTFMKSVGKRAYVPQSSAGKQSAHVAQFGADVGYAPITIPAGVFVGAVYGTATLLLKRA